MRLPFILFRMKASTRGMLRFSRLSVRLLPLLRAAQDETTTLISAGLTSVEALAAIKKPLQSGRQVHFDVFSHQFR